jgi:hypothetical protein
MASIIQIRRDTSTNWTTNNPILAQGELGLETNTNKLKVGNGTSAWNSLSYLIGSASTYLTTADIGTTVQAYDSDLTSWAAITPSSKQDTLVSGTNIKTINGTSVLGSGNITISSGGSGTVTSVGSGTGLLGGPITTTGTLSIDTSIVTTLTAVQTLTNKTLTSPTLNSGYTEQVFAVTGTTPALSPLNGSIQTWTLTANSTPTAGSWSAGQSMTLMVDDSSGFTVTWTSIPVTWKTNTGSAPTLNTTGYTAIALWKVGTVIYGARVGDA